MGVLYLVWGSTFLGLRVALEGGFEPLWLGAIRTAMAGGALLVVAVAGSKRWRVTRRELSGLAGSGLLMWIGGNGAVMWAVPRVGSGYAALAMALSPIWVGVIEAGLARAWPGRRAALCWVLGLIGLLVLSWPRLMATSEAPALLPALVLLAGTGAWAAGAILQRCRARRLDATVAASYQMLAAALGFAVFATLLRVELPRPTSHGWWALGYLAVVGSMIGLSCFASAMRKLPSRVVMTHAYVNPLVAVVLGCWLAGESVGASTLAGGVLVIGSVVVGSGALPRPGQDR